MFPIYKYQPLEIPESIRVLVLHPAQNLNDPLQCDLVHRHRRQIPLSLDSNTNYYEAVSYAWGDCIFSRDLICGGNQLIKITPNVDSMLRRLRRISKLRNLWVDSVSINQRDMDEKRVQVPLMGQIYHQASKVHVWLGDADQEVGKVFAFLRTLATVGNDNVTLQLIREILVNLWGNTSTEAVDLFLQRPWFQRRWILQEIAFSREAIVRCSTLKVSWEWLVNGLENLRLACEYGLELGNRAIISLHTMCNLHKDGGRILGLLWDFDSAKCSDPRDRLFAIYSLARDISYDKTEGLQQRKQKIHAPLDYNANEDDLYSAFATSCIDSGHFLEILRHVLAFG
ncbi:hypothetical protein K469DRAFT_659772, partial [Zopfia rhizophila CBS 207.26]